MSSQRMFESQDLLNLRKNVNYSVSRFVVQRRVIDFLCKGQILLGALGSYYYIPSKWDLGIFCLTILAPWRIFLTIEPEKKSLHERSLRATLATFRDHTWSLSSRMNNNITSRGAFMKRCQKILSVEISWLKSQRRSKLQIFSFSSRIFPEN